MVSNISCEHLRDPQGIDAAAPRLSWILSSAERGQSQTAYQVLVATTPQELAKDNGDIWNSGKVMSDRSVLVAYAGAPLRSGSAYYWKVRVWDRDGNQSAWSRTGTWSMGLLSQQDWQGPWIGLDGGVDTSDNRRLPARWLRKDFSVKPGIARAVVFVAGLGSSELYCNGTKVSDDVLSPALSDYTKRVYYVTRDVTAMLKAGENTLGVVLGNGRFFAPRLKAPVETITYGYPKLRLQLQIEYADGSVATIVSDGTWKLSADGPIRANNEYDGEEYDARMEFPGWASPGYNDVQWRPAEIVAAPPGPLRAQMIDPIRVTQTLTPVSVREIAPGKFIYDMGQNLVGWCRLFVRGPRGTAVTLRHAETLTPEGTLFTANLRSAKAADTYTLRGDGNEVYEPRFTYHGFRYVEVTGYPGTPDLATLQGRVVHDDVASAGSFLTSDPVINRIYSNIVWGVRGNYRSMPTDCPQRDERQGWLGDRSSESYGAAYIFDIAAFYAKWVQDMEDAQRENGSVSDVCPAYWAFYSDNATWPGSTVMIPHALFTQYADTGLIRRHYGSMVRWMDHMATYMKGDIMPKDTYGDWCVPPEDPKLIHSQDPMRKTPGELLGTAFFYHELNLMTRFAGIVGKPEDAQRFAKLAARLKKGFHAEFFDKKKGYYANGSQTACVIPLAFGLVPEEHRKSVFARLVAKIENETKGHVGTGLVGAQWQNRVLTENGRPDLVHGFVSTTSYPSWGYMASKGATTIWELWNGDTADPGMNSGNHVMLVGDLVIWLYENLAGLASDPACPGFKHIIMKPTPVGDLTRVQASHRTPYGEASSAWSRMNGVFTWDVTVPVNTTATLMIPRANGAQVYEGMLPLSAVSDVRVLREEHGAVVCTVGAGTYSFIVK
jgi:alpha-L-rhamnosidase